MIEDPGEAFVIGYILTLILVPLVGILQAAFMAWVDCYRHSRQIKRRMAAILEERQAQSAGGENGSASH